MKRDIVICVSVASVSLIVAAVFHRFFPGFGITFKPLLWPLAMLPFCVRTRCAVTTSALVPLLSCAVNGMPAFPVAASLSVLAGAAVFACTVFIRVVAFAKIRYNGGK